ncbi:hypothetical protein HJG45_07395 [Roseicella sp. DB1501]|nr:hypothetical protein [Roseicella sp. DB1501]
MIRTACPHDCPSACVLEVERLSPARIGRVRGSASYDDTAGTCCAKVARYAERVHHPGRRRSRRVSCRSRSTSPRGRISPDSRSPTGAFASGPTGRRSAPMGRRCRACRAIGRSWNGPGRRRPSA